MPTRIIERIEWVDSGRTDGWVSMADLGREAIGCVSFGFILHEDESTVTIAGTAAFDHSGDFDQVLNPLAIPKVAIRSRRQFAINGVTDGDG